MKETPTEITYTGNLFKWGDMIMLPNNVNLIIIDIVKNSDNTRTVFAMSKSTWIQRWKIRLINRLRQIF